jgi:hypothetical protein
MFVVKQQFIYSGVVERIGGWGRGVVRAACEREQIDLEVVRRYVGKEVPGGKRSAANE